MKTNYNPKNGIIIIGGHVQGLGIARIYGRLNIPVILLDNVKINLTKHSKYCNKFILYKKNELLDFLVALGKKEKYNNWLLIPTNDNGVGVLGNNKEVLSKYYKVSTENFKVLDFFYNKRNTYKLAKELEIPIPNTLMVDSWDEIDKLNIKYPCIIKPAIMHVFYSKTKKKVFVCNTKEELKSNYKKALELIPNDEVIIQDIIPGNSENQYSVCFMFNRDKPLVTLTVRRARQHPIDFGNATTYAETVDVPEIVTNAIKILKKVRFNGVCEVEFKYDIRDKTYKFLEVNPRTWKWHSIAENSGSPLLLSLYNNMYDLEPIIKTNQDNATFRHLITDIPTVIKMRLLNIKFNKTKKNTKYAVFDIKDIKPFIFEFIYLPYNLIKR